MNTTVRRTLTAFAAASTMFAATSALAAAPDSTMRTVSLVDCAHRSLPSLAKVGAWYGTNNGSRAYALRTQLMIQINRACHASTDGRVALVLRQGAQPPALVAEAPRR